MRTETSGVTSSRGTDRDRTPALNLVGVTKVYGKDGTEVRALNGVSVAIPRGTFTAVMGPSGSGKSTFMHCAAGLDRPTSGSTESAGPS